MIGASAGVMAVFIFICTYTPDQEIRFIFINIKLKYLGIAYFILDVIQIPYGNSGGHLAHIGGAVLGFLYARQLAKGKDIGASFQNIWHAVFQKKQLKTVYRSTQKKSSLTKNEKEGIAIGVLFTLSCIAILGATHKGKSDGFVVSMCVLSMISLGLIVRILQLYTDKTLNIHYQTDGGSNDGRLASVMNVKEL